MPTNISYAELRYTLRLSSAARVNERLADRKLARKWELDAERDAESERATSAFLASL